MPLHETHKTSNTQSDICKTFQQFTTELTVKICTSKYRCPN